MFGRVSRICISALGFLLLILDSRTALNAGQEAINLCIYSIIPSIFPFLILGNTLTNALCGANLRLLRPLGRILRIPNRTEGLFITGILGGYPTGAQVVAQAWESRQISKAQAQRMLAFCSNAGPSFLFGILGSMFPKMWMPWLLWGIHIFSAIAVSVLIPATDSSSCVRSIKSNVTIADSLKNAVKTMGIICGWIILFRVILAFSDCWFLYWLPESLRITVHGILELANGCCSLDAIASTGMRFVISGGILAFGGICVVMQTVSVTGKLGIRTYLEGKLMQTAISVLLCYFSQYFLFSNTERVAFPVYFVIILALIPVLSKMKVRKNKKSVAILR